LRGDEKDQLKISAPLPLRETYPLVPFSAKQISLDSPFKENALLKIFNGKIAGGWPLASPSCHWAEQLHLGADVASGGSE
jgi:hypothetical protein